VRIFTIIGIVCLVIGGYFAYQAWFTPASDNPFDFGKAAAPTVAITFLIIGFTFTIVGSLILRMGRARKELLTTGLVGRAEVVSASQTSMYVNEQPVVQLQLNVMLPGRPVYQVSHKEVIPLLAIASIQPGHTVPVAVDPTNPNKLAIDWGGVTAGRATMAADAGAGIGPAAMGWSESVTPNRPPQPNTLSAMPPQSVAPPAPAANTLSSVPALGQSLPPGAAGGVGFAAPFAAPSAAPSAAPVYATPTYATAAFAAPSASTPTDGMTAYLAYLRTSGIPGRGLIRSAQDTGVNVRGDQVLMLQLDVSPSGGNSYPVTTTAMLPPATIGRAVAGRSVAVYIDRSNPQAVAIDWDAA
jgi:hypothetical protein